MRAEYWLVAGLLLGVIEAFFPAGVFLFFGLGALTSALLALVDGQLVWQVVCFAVVSLLSLVLLRQRWRRLFSGKRLSPGSEVAHPLEGQVGHVRETVSAEQPGVVEVGGSFWRAVPENREAILAAGTSVRVLGALPQNGLVLRVMAGGGETVARQTPAEEKLDR